GVFTWAKGFGDAVGASASDIAADSNVNVLVTGTISVNGVIGGTIDFGGGHTVTAASGNTTDAFVAKLDTDGVGVWAKAFGDAAGHQSGGAIGADAAGDAVV